MIDHSVIEKEAAFAEEMKGRALKAEKQLRDLRIEAQAFLDALDHGDCDTVWSCQAADPPVCTRTATQMFLYDALCDEHADEHRAEHPGLDLKPRELSYAPALRRLRALLAG